MSGRELSDDELRESAERLTRFYSILFDIYKEEKLKEGKKD